MSRTIWEETKSHQERHQHRLDELPDLRLTERPAEIDIVLIRTRMSTIGAANRRCGRCRLTFPTPSSTPRACASPRAVHAGERAAGDVVRLAVENDKFWAGPAGPAFLISAFIHGIAQRFLASFWPKCSGLTFSLSSLFLFPCACGPHHVQGARHPHLASFWPKYLGSTSRSSAPK